MIVEELLVKLGFFSDLKGLKSFQSRMGGVKKSILGMFEVLEATGVAISGFFAHHLEGIDQQAKFSRQVGISIEKLQELQYAANISGSSTEDLNSSIRSLNKSIFEASEGVGGAVEVFGRLNIATMEGGRLRPTVAIFKELADKIKSLPKPQQEDFAQRIGISQSTILLLQKGSSGIQELMNEAQQLGIYSEEDAKKAEEYTDSWRALVQIFRILKNQIALGLAPVFTKIVKSFTEWLKVNRQLVTHGITNFIRVVVFVLEALGKAINLVLTGITKLIDYFGDFQSILLLIGTSVGLFALLRLPKIILSIATAFRAAAIAARAFDIAAYLPAILAAAAFSALVVIIQDIIVWLLNGKSILGEWIGPVTRLTGFFKNLYHVIRNSLIGAFQAVWNFFNEFIEDIEKRIKAIGDFFANIYQKTKHIFHFESDNNSPILSDQIPLTNGTEISNIINNNNQVGDKRAEANTTNNFTVNVTGGGQFDVNEAVKQGIYQAARQAQRNNSSPVRI